MDGRKRIKEEKQKWHGCKRIKEDKQKRRRKKMVPFYEVGIRRT